MTTGPPGASPPPLLVREAQRRLPLLRLPLVFVATLAYAGVASQTPFVGQSTVTLLGLTFLFLLCAASVTVSTNADRLDVFRVFSFYYLLVFCLGTLFLPKGGIFYFETPRVDLLDETVAYVVAAYLVIALGYHIPTGLRRPRSVPSRTGTLRREPAILVGLGFFGLGVVSWLGLVAGAGGVGVLLHSSISRNQFFGGRGFLFWPMLFMVSGGAIYFAAQASRAGTLRIRSAWPMGIAFVLLLLLQGRHRAVAPLLVAVAIAHYLIRPIRLPRFAIIAFAGLFVLIVVGVARSPALRSAFVSNPISGMRLVASDFGDQFRNLMVIDVARIPAVMVVVDKVPRRMPYDYGASLLIWLNPIRRLLGFSESQIETIGGRLYPLARPDLPPMATGFLPSMVGEFRANFPMVLTMPLFLLYGITLRRLYDRLILAAADPLAVALYAVLGLYFANMVQGTFAQDFFEMLVVTAPVALTRWLTHRAPETSYVPEGVALEHRARSR